MSCNAMCAVHEHSKSRGIHFHVLLTMGDGCCHNGMYETDGTLRGLAKRARMSVAEVKLVVDSLVESGELVRVGCAGPSGKSQGLAINLPGSGYSDLLEAMEATKR